MRLCVHRMKLLALSIGSVVSSVSREGSVMSLCRADVTSTGSRRRFAGASILCKLS